MNEHQENLVSSIPSRQLAVWRRLYTRFSLEPGPASISPDVLKTIIPVTNVDTLLQVVTPISVSLDLFVGGGVHVVGYTVPTGRRGTVMYSRRGASTGATQLQAVVGGINLTLSPAGLTAEAFLGTTVPLPFVMDQGDTLGMAATNNAADTGVSLRALVLEEESF